MNSVICIKWEVAYWIFRKQPKCKFLKTRNTCSNSDEFKQAICTNEISSNLNFHTIYERAFENKKFENRYLGIYVKMQVRKICYSSNRTFHAWKNIKERSPFESLSRKIQFRKISFFKPRVDFKTSVAVWRKRNNFPKYHATF